MEAIPAGTDLSQITIQQNPNGNPPNLLDPPSLIAAVRGLSITFTLISLCFIIARLSIYARIGRPFGLDDVSVILAWIFSASYAGMTSAGIGAAVCRHAWDTTLNLFTPGYAKVNLVLSIWYGPMMFFAKSSILLLYIRVFHLKRWLKVVVYSFMALLFCVYGVSVPLAFVYCTPHDGIPWGIGTAVRCSKLVIPGFVQGSFNIVADIIIITLPLPVIYKLEISMGKKLAMTLIFATGLLVLIASILTMVFRVYVFRGADSTWQQGRIWICVQAEQNATIWVACMPSLAKLLNINLKETKLYACAASLVNILSRSKISSDGSPARSGSTNSLQISNHQVKVEHSSDTQPAALPLPKRDDQIYKVTTFGVSVERKDDMESDSSKPSTL